VVSVEAWVGVLPLVELDKDSLDKDSLDKD